MASTLPSGDFEPKTEDLVNRITKVEQAKHLLSKELQGHKMQYDAMTKELDELNGENKHLQELLDKKQETLSILQLSSDKKMSDNQRQQQLSETHNERIESLTSKIQEEKLKRRKQRMELENQLEELIRKHKSLCELHNDKRLVLEISQMEESKKQLLIEESEEKNKLAEVVHAAEQLRKDGAAPTAEDIFLRSAEAMSAQCLLQEENASAQAKLEAMSERHTHSQEKYKMLMNELEAARID
ncbi:synaptonemal complex central element 1 isoform X1 [Pelobates cultripes]|uniref:Synaptonemal complex central element 1 isoform X1 n=1 Tax=Pelobates cultripes TaxID=61616 RepID=A0AAD1S4F6_PELCU|nr:synaptonemal complex central element 1 isoform X1 [Pelobates cultripes]